MSIGSQRALPARSAGRGAVDDSHAAAQRHGLAAHRPCARQYASGRPDAPRAHAWQGRAVGRRHGPCRHRHADGRRAQPRKPGRKARGDRPRGLPRACVGVEGAVGRRDHPPASPPRRVVRLVERALHDGPGLLEGRDQGLRRALQSQARLPRQAAGELGSQVPDRDQRPRGREPRSPGPHVALQISARGG